MDQRLQYGLTAEKVLYRHKFVGFVGLLQVPGAVGEAVDVPQGPGDDGGVGVAWEEARLRLFARDGLTGVLEGAEQRGVPVEGDTGPVAGDPDGDTDPAASRKMAWAVPLSMGGARRMSTHSRQRSGTT